MDPLHQVTGHGALPNSANISREILVGDDPPPLPGGSAMEKLVDVQPKTLVAGFGHELFWVSGHLGKSRSLDQRGHRSSEIRIPRRSASQRIWPSKLARRSSYRKTTTFGRSRTSQNVWRW
jgi:hypothetical protein